MFDDSKLSITDQIILDDFFKRRNFFKNYLLENSIELETCPSCGYPTLLERGGYEICSVCSWEDDNQDDQNANRIFGGPNGNLSLTENRINIGKILDEGKSTTFAFDNSYADSVLEKIKFFNLKQNEISSRMTGEESLQSPIWKEWKQIEIDLRNAINELNKF